MSLVTGDQEVTPADASADEAGTAPGDRRFRPDVEGLRAIAVLLVVLYHANLPGLSGGFVGVDVFFVISGFVITGLLLRERKSTGRTSLVAFYGRRVRRILPAATLVIIVVVIATYAVLGAYSGNPTAIAARWTAVFLANVHFAGIGTSYLTATLPPSPLQNFWSLAVEEQFYLVYPAIVLVAATIRSTVSLRARLLAILVPIILASLLLSAVQTGTSPDAAFFSPLTRAWELALGALVAVVTPTLLYLHRTVAVVFTWVGLGAILVAATAYSSATAYPGTAVVLPVVGTALVIAGGTMVPRLGVESLLRLGPFQWLGRLSYSLYLWHWPILVIAAEYAGQRTLAFHRSLGWLAVALAAAWLSYRAIENPARHARRLARSRWLPLGLGVLLVTVSLLVATAALTVHPDRTAGSPGGARPTATYTPAQVQRMVADAPRITRLPPDLTPTLAGVSKDWGGPVPPCWPDYGQVTVAACVFGDPTGSHTMVLYGDSHAAMWFDVINLIAALSHWRLEVLAKGYCPVVDLPFANPTGWGAPGGVFTACARWHRFAVDRIGSTHPDLVIVTQESDLGSTGSVYSPATWEQATASAIRQLPVSPTRVTVLGNIPTTTRNGPACLAANPLDVQQCSRPNSGYFAEHNVAEQQAAVATGARYIDTVPWFCMKTCTDVIGRYQPYWDPYHVTAMYSLVLGQMLGYSIDLPAYAAPAAALAPATSAAPASTVGTG